MMKNAEFNSAFFIFYFDAGESSCKHFRIFLSGYPCVMRDGGYDFSMTRNLFFFQIKMLVMISLQERVYHQSCHW